MLNKSWHDIFIPIYLLQLQLFNFLHGRRVEDASMRLLDTVNLHTEGPSYT